MKKSILLYKTSRAFSRFIKNSYLENYDVHNYNRYNIEDAEKKKYKLSFIQIENIEDLVVFASIYSTSEKVYIISSVSQINGMLSRLCDVVILDNSMLRKDIVKMIENNLKLSESLLAG